MSEEEEVNHEMRRRAKLFKKKRKARDAMHDIAKAGTNKSQGYDFVRAEDFIREVESACGPAGLCVDFDVWEIGRHIAERTNQYGKVSYWTIISVRCEVTLTDSDTGYSIKRTAVAEANDTGDKATSKANTQVRKLALQNLFNLVATDDLEADESVDQPHGEAKKPAAKNQGTKRHQRSRAA